MNVIFMPMFLIGLAGVSRRLYDGGAHLRLRAAGPPAGTSSRRGGAWALCALPDPVHLQLLLEHLEGRAGRRQSVGGDDARVGGAVAAAARQLRHAAGSVPGPVRVQRARRGAGLPAAAPEATREIAWRFPIHGRSPPRHRADQRQDRHLAVPRVGGDAVRRPVRELHPAPRGRAELAARRHDPQRAAGHVQHGRADHVVGHDGHGVGVADARATSGRSASTCRRRSCSGSCFSSSSTSSTATSCTRRLYPSTSNFLAIYFTLTGLHMLHVVGGMAVNACSSGPGAKLWKTELGVVHQPRRELGAVLALRRPGLDLSLPDSLSAVGA